MNARLFCAGDTNLQVPTSNVISTLYLAYNYFRVNSKKLELIMNLAVHLQIECELWSMYNDYLSNNVMVIIATADIFGF